MSKGNGKINIALLDTVEIPIKEPMPQPQPVAKPEAKKVDPPKEAPANDTDITWACTLKGKAGVKTKCIVIDSLNYWNEGVMVDLKCQDTSDFTWGYYGERLPVLVEKHGVLVPYIQTDIVGESPSRLYKASNPEGFKNTFKHENSMLKTLAIGLMVALVFGLFFLIYLLINQKPTGEAVKVAWLIMEMV